MTTLVKMMVCCSKIRGWELNGGGIWLLIWLKIRVCRMNIWKSIFIWKKLKLKEKEQIVKEQGGVENGNFEMMLWINELFHFAQWVLRKCWITFNNNKCFHYNKMMNGNKIPFHWLDNKSWLICRIFFKIG